METNKLYKLAVKNGVTVDRFPMSENFSASVVMGSKYFIAVDNNLSGAEEKVCLAHEMGHCITGSFYNIYAPLDIREKHEHRANCWAIKKLVPEQKLFSACKNGYDNIYSLAEFFGVTPDFMQKAVNYYKEKVS